MSEFVKETIKKELNKYFKVIPIDPYKVIVNYDIDSGEKPSDMWVVYHEFKNEPKKGYVVAYEEIDKSYNVIEWINNHWEHVCIGGNSFIDAFNSM